MRLRFLTVSIFVFGLLLQSCSDDVDSNENKVSRYDGTESHNNGQRCEACHTYGGSGEGWFNISGSVYDSTQITPFKNATILFYTEPAGAGSLVYIVEGDALGNFYTTERVDFGSGLFPAVLGNQHTEYMQTSITDADCNSCHGDTVDKIWTK